ncbi:Transcription initiation factor TFIID subunit 4 [Halocaridina rubra]|uniref:Transcription initiation factor TFIID subunit 4 n=1 Tax=Halocaridina rubra TaxID=373956 RepID=A0AAN8ZZV0_HALRR
MCACAGQFVCWAGAAKMATSNSLDEVLCSNPETAAVAVTPVVALDESAIRGPAKAFLKDSNNAGIVATEVPLEVKSTKTLPSSATPKGLLLRVPANKRVCGGVGALETLSSTPPVEGGPPAGVPAAGIPTAGVLGVTSVNALPLGVPSVRPGHNTLIINNSSGVGVSPSPMTGGQGATVNGGVPLGGSVKGLSKVLGSATAAGAAAAAATGVGGGQAPTAVIMSKPGTVTAVPSTATPGNVTALPQGMQIINMRPGTIKTTQGTTTLGPRMILSQAQVIPGVRQGQPGQLTLGTLQGLPPGAQGHLLVKTENGQLQLLRVNTAAAPPGQIATTVTTTSLQQAPNATYRFQQPQGGTVAVRSVMVSSASAPRPNTIILQSQASNEMNARGSFQPHRFPSIQNTAVLSTATTTTSVATATQAATTVAATSIPTAAIGTTIAGTIIAPTTLATTTATSQSPQPVAAAAAAGQTITAESAKTKCKNFLATLLKLANDQRAPVARNVRNLIQGLIDGRVEPEAFTEELQKDLNSSPQPCLVPFLKKTLPYLRVSLAKGELSIDGVRPPSISTVPPVTGVTTVIPTMTITRPAAPPTSGTAVRMVPPVAATATAVVHRPVTAAPTPTPARVVTQQVQQVRVQGGKAVVTTVRQNTTTPTTTAAPTTTTTTTTPTATKAFTANKAIPAKDKEKSSSKDKVFTYSSSYSSSGVTDDDINDVAAMGGVNLGEESQRILDSTGFVGTQIRSCKDEHFLLNSPLTQRIRQICTKFGLDEPPKDVVALVSHATQERLKTIVEKLAVISEHRLDIIKSDGRYEIQQDVKGQLRFLEELDKLEKKRKDEQEREILLRAAKSRSKSEDPEQAKLKAKAKEMQRVEMEEMRQRDANRTALNALQGPKKKPKLDLSAEDGATFSGTFTQKSMPLRPRIKRVNMRDLMFLMEQEKELNKSLLLYRSYLK